MKRRENKAIFALLLLLQPLLPLNQIHDIAHASVLSSVVYTERIVNSGSFLICGLDVGATEHKCRFRKLIWMGGSNQIGNISLGTIATSYSMTGSVTVDSDAMMIMVKDGYKLLKKPLRPVMPAVAYNQAMTEHDMGSTYSLNSVRCLINTVFCTVKRNLINGNSEGFLKMDVTNNMAFTTFSYSLNN